MHAHCSAGTCPAKLMGVNLVADLTTGVPAGNLAEEGEAPVCTPHALRSHHTVLGRQVLAALSALAAAKVWWRCPSDTHVCRPGVEQSHI